MHLKKLISDFNITSNLFLNVQHLELQLQLKISKVSIICFLFQNPPETNSVYIHFIFAVCHFSK